MPIHKNLFHSTTWAYLDKTKLLTWKMRGDPERHFWSKLARYMEDIMMFPAKKYKYTTISHNCDFTYRLNFSTIPLLYVVRHNKHTNNNDYPYIFWFMVIRKFVLILPCRVTLTKCHQWPGKCTVTLCITPLLVKANMLHVEDIMFPPKSGDIQPSVTIVTSLTDFTTDFYC